MVYQDSAGGKGSLVLSIQKPKGGKNNWVIYDIAPENVNKLYKLKSVKMEMAIKTSRNL